MPPQLRRDLERRRTPDRDLRDPRVRIHQGALGGARRRLPDAAPLHRRLDDREVPESRLREGRLHAPREGRA